MQNLSQTFFCFSYICQGTTGFDAGGWIGREDCQTQHDELVYRCGDIIAPAIGDLRCSTLEGHCLWEAQGCTVQRTGWRRNCEAASQQRVLVEIVEMKQFKIWVWNMFDPPLGATTFGRGGVTGVGGTTSPTTGELGGGICMRNLNDSVY